MQKTKELRHFAFIWMGIFLFIGLLPLFKGDDIRLWGLFISIVFGATGILKPSVLAGFYKIWTQIGAFIGGIVSKIILAILFFGFFTPVAFVLRFFKKDLLHKNIDKTVSSYWIVREEQPESMKNQF